MMLIAMIHRHPRLALPLLAASAVLLLAGAYLIAA